MLVPVIDFDKEPVSRSEADHLDIVLASAAGRQVDDALANEHITGADRHRRERLPNGALEPGEDLRERIPEGCHGEERRKLVFEHVGRSRLEIRTVRLKISYARNADALEFAFGAQDLHEAPRFRACLAVSVKVHHVVKVTRTRSLGEGPEFFGERLDVVVGQDVDAVFWSVGVRVKNLCANGR